MTTWHLGGAWLVAVCAALLGGCSVGPDYARPALDAPAYWPEGQEKASAAPALEQAAWWQGFGDPLLGELIAQAARSNLDLAQARARIVQARADLVIAGSAAWPTVNASGAVTRSDSSDNTRAAASAANSGPRTTYQGGFDASWEIDVFGGIRRDVERSQAKLEASIADLHATLLTLLGEVARNYIDVRAGQEQLDIARSNTQAQQQTVEVTRERYRLGLTSYLDVAQAQAQKSTTEATIPTIETAIKQSIHRVAILLGREPNALMATLAEPRALPEFVGVIASGLPAELLARRPDLRLAERNLAAASADIGVATAELYPKLDLTLGLGLQSSGSASFLERSSRYWSLVPGVTLPLYTGGRTRALIQSKQAVYDETLARYRAAFNTALEDVENALVAYYAEQDRLRTLQEAVAADRQAVELANERYRRGLTTFLDVLTAENSLLSAQRSLSLSRASLLNDLVALYKALGGGWGNAEVRAAEGPLGPIQ